MTLSEKINNTVRNVPDFPKPGIIFKDITPLLADAKALNDCCEKIASYAKDADYIAGIEARGFILASAVAVLSGKGFIPIRKSGKLPGQVISQSYELEYGQATLEIHSDLVPAGKKVLIVDLQTRFNIIRDYLTWKLSKKKEVIVDESRRTS